MFEQLLAHHYLPAADPIMRKHTLLIAAVSIVVVSTAAIFLMRRGLQWTPPADLEQLAAQTSDQYKGSHTVPTADTDRVATVLAAAPVTPIPGGDALPDIARSSLDVHIAKFLELRALADAEKYADWMRSQGAVLIEHPPSGPSGPMLGHRFKQFLGRERTPEDTPWDVFRLLFEAECRRYGPAAIVSRPDSAEYLTGSFTAGSIQSFNEAIFNGIAVERLLSSGMTDLSAAQEWTHELAKLHWYMGQTYVGISHWAPKRTPEDILTRDGMLHYVEAHIVTHSKSGDILPTVIYMYYDAADNLWIIDSMHYVNTYALALGLGAHF